VNSIPTTFRTYWLALLFVMLNLALLAVAYRRLPDAVPLLWSTKGSVIFSMSKPFGALLLPLLHAVITLFLMAAPALDPGTLRAPQTPRFYPLAVAIISGFLMLATSLVLAAALGAALSVPHVLFGGFGVLVALIGNYLGKVPKNQMVGIRTPWTLSSEYVWERTHRFAAPLFVTSGSALFLYCVLQRNSLSPLVAGAIIAATALAPYCYSYLIWKRSA
jgi:uncharacterized membrane protein